MHTSCERGNASIGVVVGTALAGLLYLQTAQQDMSSQVNLARNAKLRTESNEAALYALSVASQLLKKEPATNVPRMAAEEIVEPNPTEKLQLRALTAIPGGAPIAIDAHGALLVTAPLGGKTNASDLNRLFSNQNFSSLDTSQVGTAKTVVRVQVSGFASFSTGYGIQQVTLDASLQVSDRTISKDQMVRALLPMDVPEGICELEVSADGVKLANGASVAHDKVVTANMKCEGVILSADINVNGTSTTVGAPTAANDYASVVPSLFPTPVAITGEGVKEVRASYLLLDGARRDLPLFTLNVMPPPPAPSEPVADITKCLHKCNFCPLPDAQVDGCTQNEWDAPLRKPFPKDLTGILPWPAIDKALDGPEDIAERARLQSWALGKGIWMNAVVMLSLAYPRYGEVLVCQGNGTIDWEPHGFDPLKDCEEVPVAPRLYIGCLDPESLITIRPGVVVPLRTLRAGHTIYNPVTKTFATIRRVIKGPEKKAMNRIEVGGQELLLTANHPVLTEQGERMASDVSVNDRMQVGGGWVRVDANESFLPQADQEVWNIEIGGEDVLTEHWLEANGIIVGDLWMQERLNQ